MRCVRARVCVCVCVEGEWGERTIKEMQENVNNWWIRVTGILEVLKLSLSVKLFLNEKVKKRKRRDTGTEQLCELPSSYSLWAVENGVLQNPLTLPRRHRKGPCEPPQTCWHFKVLLSPMVVPCGWSSKHSSPPTSGFGWTILLPGMGLDGRKE